MLSDKRKCAVRKCSDSRPVLRRRQDLQLQQLLLPLPFLRFAHSKPIPRTAETEKEPRKRKRATVALSSSRLFSPSSFVASSIISTIVPIRIRNWKLTSMPCRVATRWFCRVTSILTRMLTRRIVIPSWPTLNS